MSQAASVALAMARTILNDDIASRWTDPILMPKLSLAHMELQTMLWEVGSPVTRSVSTPITVNSTGPTGLSGPSDLLAPTKLVETATDGSDLAEMTEVAYFPLGATAAARLVYWSWRGEAIQLLGASAQRKVTVYYRNLIPVPAAVTDPLGMSFAELYIGPRVAALAAGSVGNKDVFDLATAMAQSGFGKVVAANRGQQTPANKP